MTTTTLDRALALPIVTEQFFQWRGSTDGIKWSDWRTMTARQVESAAIEVVLSRKFEWIQVRSIENRLEVQRSPVTSWRR